MQSFEPWVEIDLGAITANVRALKGLLKPSCKLLVAVKANGYGHGAVEVATVALNAGAEWLGVARCEEGVALRRAGITAPILIFSPSTAEQAADILQFDLTPSVSHAAHAAELAAAVPSNTSLKVHLKIDTGMGRFGSCAQHDGSEAGQNKAVAQVAEQAKRIASTPRIHLAGVFTHFASSDHPDTAQTLEQFQLFTHCVAEMKAQGAHPLLCHAANSGAIIRQPHTHVDMVRAGISIYGLGLPAALRNGVELTPALTLKARIALLKQVPKGASISYGMTHRARESALIATIPIGYGDGYARAHSNRGCMLVRGQRAPIVGRVCMDSTMVDVTNIAGVSQGDEVVIIGAQGSAHLSAAEVASTIDTIDYEVVTSLQARVRRIYSKA